MTSLRPFIRYYGSKWRAVHAARYPHPLHKTIVEPFAGGAGYSLHYFTHDVILVEKYPALAEMWRWLTRVSFDEVMRIPLVDSVDDLPSWTPEGARTLIGFSMNAAVASPRKTLSTAARKLRELGRKFYGWTEAMRCRVAIQAPMIHHWKVIEGDYTSAPDIEATWYVDQPYEGEMGGQYVFGSSGIDYPALASWCLARRGQPIVCEALGAKWLPFRPLGAAKAGPRSKVVQEAVWP